jgi:hypothetical protein
MSNLGLERYLEGLGLTLERTAVGDRYVLEMMREQGYNLGGEQSGHVVCSDFGTTGDGLVSALQVLSAVRRSERLVSEVCHSFEPVPQVLKNVRYKSGNPLASEKVKQAIRDGESQLEAGGRVLVRASGTETLILFPGRLTGWKGQRDAIDAAALLAGRNLQGWRMIIAGDAQGRAGRTGSAPRPAARPRRPPPPPRASPCRPAH